jgi:hypothetical protein
MLGGRSRVVLGLLMQLLWPDIQPATTALDGMEVWNVTLLHGFPVASLVAGWHQAFNASAENRFDVPLRDKVVTSQPVMNVWRQGE